MPDFQSFKSESTGTTYYVKDATARATMTGATASAAGKQGQVPAPASGSQDKFLRGDGTWAVPTDTTISVSDAPTTAEKTNFYIPVVVDRAYNSLSQIYTMYPFQVSTYSDDSNGHTTLILGSSAYIGEIKLYKGAWTYTNTYLAYPSSGDNTYYLVGTTTTSAVGSYNQPVFVNSDGVITACSTSLNEYLPLSGGKMTGTTYYANDTTYYVDSSANAKFARVESAGEIIGGGSLSVGRKSGSIAGTKSVAAGYNNTASGTYSVALGYNNTASGSDAVALGASSIAYGTGAVSLGNNAGSSSYSNYGGLCAGYYVYPSYSATSSSYAGRTILGRYNSTCGSADMLVVGAGTSSTKKNVFRVTSAGAVYGLSAFNSSGADYAEWLREWHDGNPDNEDRVGYFVTIGEDDKLHFANDGDYICGITSGNPSIIGNADEDYYWKWERDEFNRIKYKEIPVEYDELDEDGNPVIDEETGLPKKYYSETETTLTEVVSEDYNESLALSYVPRKDRPEWDCVGMMGVLPVRDDGTCIKGQYCKCGQGGIATLATERGFDTYMVIDRITENVVSVLLK